MEKLTWKKVNEQHILFNNEQELLNLQLNLTGSSSFQLNNKTYNVAHKSDWNTNRVITQDNETILTTKGNFWSSNSDIIWKDGTIHSLRYNSKSPLQMMFSAYNTPFITYAIFYQNQRPTMTFNCTENVVDTEKLLILLALGFIIFSVYCRELGTSDDLIMFLPLLMNEINTTL